MNVSVRAYLMAGVAAVGATAVAISPVQAVPPEITVAADQRAAIPVVSPMVDLLAASRVPSWCRTPRATRSSISGTLR